MEGVTVTVMDDNGYNTRSRSKKHKKTAHTKQVTTRRSQPTRKVKPKRFRDDIREDDIACLESSSTGEESNDDSAYSKFSTRWKTKRNRSDEAWRPPVSSKRCRAFALDSDEEERDSPHEGSDRGSRADTDSEEEDDSDYHSSDCSSRCSSEELMSPVNRRELDFLQRDNHRLRSHTSTTPLGSMLLDALLREDQDQDVPEAEQEEQQYIRTLTTKDRREYRRKEQEIIDHTKNIVPLRCRVVQFDIQASSKLCILNKLDMLQRMDEGSGEYPKLKTWIDSVMKIPFGKYDKVPVQLCDGVKSIRRYLRTIQRALDTTVHGHATAKGDIMQLVSQWISNPQSMSKVLGIAGPPGTGKTTLVRHGIAKALGRPFIQISLGGATDACTLNGHSYTYEGAVFGKIAACLMESKTMNPVIFFDELDKVSESKTGQEIIGLLIHLTDSTQNDQFIDRYFDGVPLDLSRALMIFSFNDEERLCPILKDRMTVVSTEPFKIEDKIEIATKHLLPAILDNTGFNRKDIFMEEKDVRFCVGYVPKEEGVRNLKRAIESAVMKLNVLRLTGGTLRERGSSDSVPDIPYRIQNLKFPIQLNEKLIAKLVPTVDKEGPPGMMYT